MDQSQQEQKKKLTLIKFPRAKKGSEVTYQDLSHEFAQYKEYIQNNLQKVILDFTDSSISKKIAQKVMESLFSKERGNCYGLIQNLEKLKVKAFSTQLSSLDFLQHFSNLPKNPPITIHCDYNLASNFLKLSTKFPNDIKCKGHFDKRANLYFIYCSHSLLDSKAQIEKSVIELALRVNKQNVSDSIKCIKKLSILKVLNLEIHSLNNIKEDFMHFTEALTQVFSLEILNIKFYLNSYLPHINKQKLKNLKMLKYDYQSYDVNLNLGVGLKLLQVFQEHNDTLIIDPLIQFENSELTFNFNKRLLNEEEFQEFQSFLQNLHYETKKISISFDDNQKMSLKNWVGIMNNLRIHKKLQTIIVQYSNIATSVSALCVAKLYKCKKAHIRINQSYFINNNLTLYFYWLYDHILDVVIQNVFELKEPGHQFKIQNINIQANSILGLTRQLSSFFNQATYQFKLINVIIQSQFDLHLYYNKVIRDIAKVRNYCETFSFEQVRNINLRSDEMRTSSIMSGIYDYHQIIQQLSITNSDLISKYLNQALQFSSYDINEESYEQFLEAYKIFIEFRKVVQLKYYQLSQPSVMLAFYTLIGPELPINPYQVYTDLYFE